MQASTTIRARSTRESMRAAVHAFKAGFPLNTYVVIRFHEVGDGHELAPKRQFTDIRTKWTSWHYYKAAKAIKEATPPIGPLHDLRTWENEGRLHVNWLIHVPPQHRAEFERKLRDKWVAAVLGKSDSVSVSIREIGGVDGLMRYIHKGIEPNEAYRFKIRPIAQGPVWGRRIGASRALGRTARQDFSS